MAIVTGQDVATALGLAASTPLDDVADVADQLLTPYLAAGALDQGVRRRYGGRRRHRDRRLAEQDSGRRAGVGIDGTPGPYRMGQSLLSRVSSLVGPWMNTASDVA